MSEVISPPRWETRAAIENLERLLHLDKGRGVDQQDWQLILADPKRLSEFSDLYEKGNLDIETKFALMMLIIASLDDMLYQKALTASEALVAERVERFLRQDFILHLHTIRYWFRVDETDPDNVFSVTPMLRRIWADCFKAKYQPWLEQN